MRQILEDATGLSIDFQVSSDDLLIQDFVDNMLGGIEIDVPYDIDLFEIYLRGEKQSKWRFSQGKQQMNGLNVLRFIKAEHDSDQYDPKMENHPRKHLIFSAFLETLKNNLKRPGFLMKAAGFFKGIDEGKKADCDFSLKTLLTDNVLRLAGPAVRAYFQEVSMPKVGRSIFIVDSAIGDGGVQWVSANRFENPITAQDWAKDIYPDDAMEIPLNADPYSQDLVTDYWGSTRRLVKERLLSKAA